MSSRDSKPDSILRNLGAFVGHIAAAVRQDVGGRAPSGSPESNTGQARTDIRDGTSPVLERRTTEVRTIDLGAGPAQVTKTVIERIEIEPAEPSERPGG